MKCERKQDQKLIKELYNKIPKKVFYNNIITKLQRDVEDGFGLRDDKSNNVKPQTSNIPVPQPTPPPHEPVKISIIMNNKPTEWKIQAANNQNKKPALFKEDSLQIIFKYHIKMETIKIKNY